VISLATTRKDITIFRNYKSVHHFSWDSPVKAIIERITRHALDKYILFGIDPRYAEAYKYLAWEWDGLPPCEQYLSTRDSCIIKSRGRFSKTQKGPRPASAEDARVLSKDACIDAMEVELSTRRNVEVVFSLSAARRAEPTKAQQ
jgi:hypothetical protein